MLNNEAAAPLLPNVTHFHNSRKWKLVIVIAFVTLVYFIYFISSSTSMSSYFDFSDVNPSLKQIYSNIISPFRKEEEIELLRKSLVASLQLEESRVTKLQIGDTSPCDVSIVILYFKLKKSKHGLDEYKNWQSNFFKSASAAPVIIYTDKESVKGLIEMASLTNNSKTFYVLDNIWNLTRLIELERSIDSIDKSFDNVQTNNLTAKHVRDYVNSYQQAQIKIDPEKNVHFPGLYAIWNAKNYIMKRSSLEANNIYKSKFFFYTDVGAFRPGVYPNWPDKEHLLKMEARLKHRMLFGQISGSSGDPYLSSTDYIEGTFFAGSPQAIKFYFDEFYAIHDDLFYTGQFVGKDQKLMNIFTQVKHPEHSCKMYLGRLLGNCINGYDIWFAYQFYFANSYNDREPSFFLNSSEVEKLPSIKVTESPSCQKKSKQYLANTDTIYCNKDTEFIAVPKCFKCN